MNEISDTEKEYMEKNSSYWTERALIDSMSKKDLYNFLVPLKGEYDTLKNEIERQYQELLQNHEGLKELSQFFLYKVIELKIGGKRIDELQNMLDRINTMIYSRVSQCHYTYPKKQIDIKDIPIANIIGRYIKLPGNLNHNIRCPLPHHDDKSPSFRIYPQTNSFYCFGCQKCGNILNFISEMEEITTKEAYKKIISLM